MRGRLLSSTAIAPPEAPTLVTVYGASWSAGQLADDCLITIEGQSWAVWSTTGPDRDAARIIAPDFA